MQVTCSHCSTTYNLPSERAKPGSKLRCSVCKNVFKLGEDEPEENKESIEFDGFGSSKSSESKKETSEKPKKSKKGLLIFFILVLLIGGGSFALWKYTDLLAPVEKIITDYLYPNQNIPAQEIMQIDRVHLIEIKNVRQYNITNEKIGKISVIEAQVINNFDAPRELIKVEATLYDKAGAPIVSKSQLAGTSASLFQLQVLGEAELDQALSNSIDILANNSNVLPNGMVPFMVLFYNPPAEATEFGVKVIDAKPVEEIKVIEE